MGKKVYFFILKRTCVVLENKNMIYEFYYYIFLKFYLIISEKYSSIIQKKGWDI